MMISDSPAETLRERSETIDWTKKQRQLNQPKTYTAAELSAMNRKFSLWFCVGIAIAFGRSRPTYLRSLG